MSRQTFAEEKAGAQRREPEERFQCCFCGKGIAPRPPDVCALVLHTTFQRGVGEETQTFFCHAACLKERLLPSVPTIL